MYAYNHSDEEMRQERTNKVVMPSVFVIALPIIVSWAYEKKDNNYIFSDMVPKPGITESEFAACFDSVRLARVPIVN